MIVTSDVAHDSIKNKRWRKAFEPCVVATIKTVKTDQFKTHCKGDVVIFLKHNVILPSLMVVVSCAIK